MGQQFLPLLEKSGLKLIINILSEAGSVADCRRENQFAYCMSKAALNMQSKILQNYLKPRGFKILAIHPGWIRTNMGGPQAPLPAEGAAEVEVLLWEDGGITEMSRISPHPSLVADVLRFFDQYGQSLQLWSPDSAAFALPGAIDEEPGIWVHLVEGGDPVNVADGSWVSWSGADS